MHQTGGEGKDANEGFDAFVPLIDSGIYVCIWSRPRFLSIILYTCAEFDEKKAEAVTAEFFGIADDRFVPVLMNNATASTRMHAEKALIHADKTQKTLFIRAVSA